MKKSIAVIFFSLFAVCMIIVVLHLFPVGDPHLPGYGDFISRQVPAKLVPKAGDSTALRYNRNCKQDVGATCVVGAVILDYRGYDTLYETTVLFTAIAAILSLIGKDEEHE